MNLLSLDRKYMGRESAPRDLEVVRTEGSYLIGPKGKKYIDFIMGWCVGNLGWRDEATLDQLRQFDGPDYVLPSYLYKGWVEVAQLLAEILPGDLTKSFRTTGGTESVDLALQAALFYTNRHKFISIEGCYHGDSLAATCLSSLDVGIPRRNMLFTCHRIQPPLNERAAEKIHALLKRRDIAGLIMEPIICNLGVLIPEVEFMREVQELCKKFGTLLIMDEVATGFGRTGKLFASEHFDLNPDIMCLAKAITGGYAPMGAMVTTNEVAEAMKDSSYYSTYGWHPRSVEAAKLNLKFLSKNRKQLEQNTNDMGDYFFDRLGTMFSPFGAQIRIKGLAVAVEFEQENYGTFIVESALEKGVLLSEQDGKTITLFPALNIDKAIASEGLDILEECAKDLEPRKKKTA